MNVVIRKYNETYVKIEADIIVLQAISDYFSFFADNYQFTPKYRAKQWDGKIRLYDMIKNLFPIGLLFKLHVWLEKQNFQIEYLNFDKTNTKASISQIENFANDILKFPFPLRDYQLEAVKTGLTERKCVLLSPTGTGKSAIIYTLIRMIQHRNKDFKFLVMVPSVGLVDQMVGDFDDYAVKIKPFSTQCQKIFSGYTKEISKKVVVSTWQSLQDLPKEFFMQFDVLLVDECHTGSTDGRVIKKLVEHCSRAKYKIGTTGTIQDAKLNEYSLNAIYGKIYQFTQTAKEIERGNLAKILINQIHLEYSEEDSKKLFKYKKQLKQKLENDKVGSTLYQAEIEFINKLDYKRNLITSICKKQKDNILILFRRNNFGKRVFDELKKIIADRQIFYIDGHTDKDIRNNVRKICENNSNVIIVAQIKVFGTGISIKRLHHVILAESLKSKITFFQSIGRSLRLHKSKLLATIYDIVDCLRYKEIDNIVLKHSATRKEMCELEGFPIKLYKVSVEQFKYIKK